METMYQMSFKEFLIAAEDERYIPIIEEIYKANKALSDAIHNALLEIYRIYLYIRDMTEVVQDYIDKDVKESGDLAKLDNKKILKDIIDLYKHDMIKYIEHPNEVLRIARIYENVPSQLAKDNPKFIFAKLDTKDNRKDNYVSAIDCLDRSNFCLFLPSN